MLLLMFTGKTMDFSRGELIGYASMIIAFSTIFFGIRSYRDDELSGRITFGQAFRIGIGITLVATAIYVIAWMIISNTIATDFMADYYQHSVEKIRASGLSEAQIEEKIEKMEKFAELYKNPIVKIGMTFLEIFPVGLVITLISSFILKKK